MQVLEFIKSKGLDVESFNTYFTKTINPIIEGVTNSKELYEAALLFEASKTKKIPFMEIHNNFNSIVALIVYELLSEDDKMDKHVNMSPGALMIALSYFHYNLLMLEERGSVEYKNKYGEEVLSIIDYILKNRVLINHIHTNIIDMIRELI